MKLELDRIISLATLVASLAAIVLVLKRPAPVAQPQSPTVIVERTASDQASAAAQPQGQPLPTTTPTSMGSPLSDIKTQAMPTAPSAVANAKSTPALGSDEMSAMVTKMLGSASGAAALSPDSNVGSSMPNIKDQQVTMEGDIVHGRFLTEIAGKEVWITISGHMGEKDGYATFEPTEFKVGDMEVPVSLVNPALQRRLAEERDRLKIPVNSGSQ